MDQCYDDLISRLLLAATGIHRATRLDAGFRRQRLGPLHGFNNQLSPVNNERINDEWRTGVQATGADLKCTPIGDFTETPGCDGLSGSADWTTATCDGGEKSFEVGANRSRTLQSYLSKRCLATVARDTSSWEGQSGQIGMGRPWHASTEAET